MGDLWWVIPVVGFGSTYAIYRALKAWMGRGWGPSSTGRGWEDPGGPE